MTLKLTAAQLEDTFAELRRCGDGRRECQMLWTGQWDHPDIVTNVVHPIHEARGDGFQLDDTWLTEFWNELARTKSGIWAQVHTHPQRAFHSPTDDTWPIIRTPGFVSLVIPRFAIGATSLKDAFLTVVRDDGGWEEVDPATALEIRR
jgi:hypothetical protein